MSALRALPPPDARVMVIDDDHDLLDAICEVLRDAGYRVSSAGNGFEALRDLGGHESLPDLILVDLMMPIMDGYTFRQLQLADPRLSGIPTIALTAGPIDGRIYAMRLAAWMNKPVSVAALIGAVERHRIRRAFEASVTAAHSAHSMQFYHSDLELAADVARLLAPAVSNGNSALVVATREHRELFEDELDRVGCDPALARTRGSLQFFDARTTLDSFLVGGRVIESRFTEVVAPMVLDAERSSRRVRAYGEMVDLLWRRGEVASAVTLEQCWNRLLATSRCDLHCAYAAPASELHRASAGWIRQQHAADRPALA
jgi:CheY-like chemotaxis protein